LAIFGVAADLEVDDNVANHGGSVGTVPNVRVAADGRKKTTWNWFGNELAIWWLETVGVPDSTGFDGIGKSELGGPVVGAIAGIEWNCFGRIAIAKCRNVAVDKRLT